MLENGRLTVRQLAALLFMCTIGEQILLFPSMITSYAHEDAWLSALLGVAGGTGILAIMLLLHATQPQLNLIQHALQKLGPWFGAVVSCFYLFYFLIGASTFVRELGDFMTTNIMRQSPLFALNLLFVGALAWGLICGIECIGRGAELFLPLVLLFLLILTVCILPQADLNNITPILAHGLLDPLKGIFAVLTYPYCQLCIFMMVFPYANQGANLKKDVLLAGIFGGLWLTLTLTMCLLVLGSFMTEHQWFPAYNLSRKINIGNFLQRIEAFIASVWIIAVFFKGILFLYGFLMGLSSLFRISSHRPLILPGALMTVSMSILVAPDEEFYLKDIIPYWIDWDITCGIVLPVLLLLIHQFRRRLRKS